MMPTLPSLSKAYPMLQQDEKQNETYSPLLSFSNDSNLVKTSTGHMNNLRIFHQRVQFDSKGVLLPRQVFLVSNVRNLGTLLISSTRSMVFLQTSNLPRIRGLVHVFSLKVIFQNLFLPTIVLLKFLVIGSVKNNINIL